MECFMGQGRDSTITKGNLSENFITAEQGKGIEFVPGAEAERWHDPAERVARALIVIPNFLVTR